MVRRSIYTENKAFRAVNHTAIIANGSTDGVSIGLDQGNQDFRTGLAVLLMGAWTDGSYALIPQESANGSTGWTNIPAERLQGGSASAGAANAIAELGFIPDPANSPFVRVRVTATGVTTGAAVQAMILLGSPSTYPVAR